MPGKGFRALRKLLNTAMAKIHRPSKAAAYQVGRTFHTGLVFLIGARDVLRTTEHTELRLGGARRDLCRRFGL